ncbi:MAG: enoyl-CoA hydratase/isomerase family protein [Bacteroidia bacterium]|nr:enoyl-CoA hydratase/isomerase family protein [Bacteroidia bacterium]
MEYVNWDVQNNIGIITLDRPEKRNALNEQVVTELKHTFKLASDSKDCKVVILKSSGSAFCAGADLDYLQQLQKNSFQENLEDSQHLMELFNMIYRHPKVIITMVDGPAIAGGCGLATVADFCFSSENASFGYTESRIGFVPAIVMVFLLRKIGEGKAKEILLTGEVFNAQRALDLGLINAVVDEQMLEQYTMDFAEKLIKKNSGQSLAMIKEMIANVPEKDLESALGYAAEMNATMRESEDCKKGISAFLNKTKITWN